MRKMEESWNLNMAKKFIPSCINVLDKIIMEWFNKYVPEFICVGLKPNPFGNERHTIFCGLTYIFWRSQILEGKDLPETLGKN